MILEEEQIAEVNLALVAWAQDVALALDKGCILTVDYGDSASRLYSAEVRFRGTLTTFYNHVQIDSPLRHIGRQDITAQVDFTSLVDVGQGNGIRTLGFASQGGFLRRLGLSGMQERLRRLNLLQNAAQSNWAGMLDLARPAGLGNFKVLAQGKGVGQPELWGFTGPVTIDDDAAAVFDNLPVPLLTSHHISLLEGRYPSGEVEIELDHLFDGPERS